MLKGKVDKNNNS